MEAVIQSIRGQVAAATSLYYRIVLLVGPSGSGKTDLLKACAQGERWSYLNVGIELGRELLPLTERERRLRAVRILGQIVRARAASVVALDNVEILFETALKLDPLRSLQDISRDTTIVAAWPGRIVHDHLEYADANHPEHKRYPLDDTLVVNIMDAPRRPNEIPRAASV
jgi:ABC-type dipeptide/oligopeptide/nickel transport system ATPase subunit